MDVGAFEKLPKLEEVADRVVLPSDVVIDERALCDLEMLLNGAMAPLEGYLTLDDYKGCLKDMRLANGQIWTIPIVLPLKANTVNLKQTTANTNEESTGSNVLKIRDFTNALLAEVEVTSVFIPDVPGEVSCLFGADGALHPYGAYLLKDHCNSFYIGGRLTARFPPEHYDFRQFRLTPAQVRERAKERGWDVMVGFQTRNPMHRSHYELTLQAMRQVEEATGKKAHLLISPAIGPTQPGDVDYRVRVRCYEKVLGHYAEEPFLVLLPLAMRMAGPREAVWHSILRKNYGCTHFIVGRDHAGPTARRTNGQPFFQPYDAHELLAKFAPEIGIEPVFGKNMLYCGNELGFVPEDNVPQGVKTDSISGTAFRSMLMERKEVPEWFCFKDVVEELHAEYSPLNERGLCVYFTGLPCSGKSTLACALRAMLLESRTERRKVTVLDADVIRTHLSAGLGFSKADRQLNVRRIGYVAHEIVKHGGICLVANIAPYQEDREFNKQLIQSVGGHYVEIYVSTPLEVCESRDIKELYRKARMGVIKQFTGISDPYEAPESPDFVVNSTSDALGKVTSVLGYLKAQKYCI